VSVFQGVDHVGVGVGDVDEAIAFYGRHVGFDRVLFDVTAELPAVEAFAGRAPRARVAMLESSGATPIGPGRVKLVQVLDGDGPAPVPAGQAWGEVGVCEICLHVRGVAEVHASLVAAGCADLMPPMTAEVPPTGISLDIAYVADPWGTKLEMIEWTGLWRSLPGPARAEGVNHVAFGVTDMGRSRAFYERLGFTALLFESFDFFDPMAPWFEEPWYDPASFRPWRLQALAFKALRDVHGDYALWRDFPYEYEQGRLAIDVINGGPGLRAWVDDVSATAHDLEEPAQRDEQAWLAARDEVLLYR